MLINRVYKKFLKKFEIEVGYCCYIRYGGVEDFKNLERCKTLI